MKTKTGVLAAKADLLVLAIAGIENIVKEENEPVSLPDVAAVKALAQEIQCEAANLAQWGDEIERLVRGEAH